MFAVLAPFFFLLWLAAFILAIPFIVCFFKLCGTVRDILKVLNSVVGAGQVVRVFTPRPAKSGGGATEYTPEKCPGCRISLKPGTRVCPNCTIETT